MSCIFGYGKASTVYDVIQSLFSYSKAWSNRRQNVDTAGKVDFHI